MFRLVYPVSQISEISDPHTHSLPHFPSLTHHTQMPYGRRSWGRAYRQTAFTRDDRGDRPYTPRFPRFRPRRLYGKYGVRNTAQLALAKATRIDQVLRGTKNLFQKAGSTTFTSTTPYTATLNLTETGDEEGNRFGDQAQGIALHIRFSLIWASSPEGFPSIRRFRVVVFRIKSLISGNHTTAWTDIFDDTNLSSTQADVAIYQRDKMGNIEVLWDEMLSIDTSNTAATVKDAVIPTKFICKYLSVTALDDLQYENSIRLLVIPVAPVAFALGDGAATFTYNSNWTYYA